MHSTVIITGAGQGLGRALAVEASARGYGIALVGRTLSKLEETKRLIVEAGLLKDGAQVTCHAFDLSSTADAATGFADIFQDHPSIVGLINNAGTWLGRKPARELSRADLNTAFDLNLFSAFEPTQAVLANHRFSKSEKLSIAFVGATASLSGRKGVAAFCLSKVALRTFAQSLARELGPEGVHISHFVVDGVLDNERTVGLNSDQAEDRFMKQNEVAKTILGVMEQDRSCWTFEMDIRPFNENW